MDKKQTPNNDTIEFRYYEIWGGYVLPQIGKEWDKFYGLDELRISRPGKLHFHNCYEIGYCYSGHGVSILGDRQYRYDDEEMFTLVPPNIPHTTNTDPGSHDRWAWMFVDMEAFVHDEMSGLAISPSEILRAINRRAICRKSESDPRCATLIRLLIEEVTGTEPYREEAIKGHLRAIVTEALRLVDERDRTPRVGKYSRYVQRAVQYISRHYTENIKIKDLADYCGLSESHFRRIFDDSIGMTPNEYINMVRIDRACTMLLREDESMTEIGERVGYQTASSFNRHFKALVGMSPLQWKNKCIREGISLKNYNISARKGWEADAP